VIRLRRTTLWHFDAGSGRRPPDQKYPSAEGRLTHLVVDLLVLGSRFVPLGYVSESDS